MAEQGTLKLPNFNEFSPGVVDSLAAVLEVVSVSQGDRKRLQESVASVFPSLNKTPGKQRLNRANNVLIGMSQCCLFDLGTNRMTPLGQELAGVSERDSLFARHLLEHHHGARLLEAAAAVRRREGSVSKKSLAKELRGRGFTLTTNSGDPGKMRLWLEPSGVVDSHWSVEEEQFKLFLGLDLGTLGEWDQLTRPQRCLLETVKRLSPGAGEPEWLDGSHVREVCEIGYGPETLPEDSLRRDVIDPVVDGGWIEATGKGEGRGGKVGRLRALSKLLETRIALEIEPESLIPAELLEKLSWPLDRIYRDLGSGEKHTRGTALELLALRIARDIGLTPLRLRERSSATGGAEVDLIADGIHLHYSRWLFQCKNTPKSAVGVAALAKEVGMAVLLNAHVVVLVTTGTFARSVQEHAERLVRTGSLQAVLIDRDVLAEYRKHGGRALVDHFIAVARHTLLTKQPQALVDAAATPEPDDPGSGEGAGA